MQIYTVLIIGFMVAVTACAQPVTGLYPSTSEAEVERSIHLVDHGWHAGIVIRRADIPRDIWPEAYDFPQAEYLEVGWGDREFYPASEFSLMRALKAVLWPSASVLHIVAFDGSVRGYFPQNKIVQLKLSPDGLVALSRFIHAAYERSTDDRPIVLGPGLYGRSQFYLSHQRYHLFRTCNVWSAQALRVAGIPVTPALAVTVKGLMRQARTQGANVP